jgi:hypothetical protein
MPPLEFLPSGAQLAFPTDLEYSIGQVVDQVRFVTLAEGTEAAAKTLGGSATTLGLVETSSAALKAIEDRGSFPEWSASQLFYCAAKKVLDGPTVLTCTVARSEVSSLLQRWDV